MLASTGFDVFFAAAGNVYLLLLIAGVALAIWRGRTRQRKAVFAVLVVLLFMVPILPELYRGFEYRQRLTKAKALFDERCKTAGEKIYRVVEGVEGITLLNLRTGTDQQREGDPYWPDAGLAKESVGDGYILSFLEWEHDSRSKYLPYNGERVKRGFLNNSPKGAMAQGYRSVDVRQENGSYRRLRLNMNRAPGAKDYFIEESVAQGSRYAVKYENIGPTEDREYWVAGAQVSVLDTQTGDIMGQLTAYSFEPGLGSRAGYRQPWGFAVTCPLFAHGSSSHATRFFVDQIAKPLQGN